MPSIQLNLRHLSLALVVTAAIALAGCGNLHSIHRTLNTNSDQGVLIDAKQRAIVVGERSDSDGTLAGKRRYVACAEPSPDALSAYAAQFDGEFGLAPVGEAGTNRNLAIRAAVQEAAASIGIRTSSIQLLRDAMFRVCEAYANGGIDDGQYELLMRRYQRHIVAMMAIEQLTQANQAQPAFLAAGGVHTLSEWADELTRQRGLLAQQEAILAQADADIQTAEAVLKDKSNDTAALQQKKNATAAKKVAMVAAAQIKGTIGALETSMVGGAPGGISARVVSIANMSAQQNDGMASAVKHIVMNVLETDDTAALCIAYYKKQVLNDGSGFYSMCKAHMELMVKEREARTRSITECEAKAKSGQSFNDCVQSSQVALGNLNHKTLSLTTPAIFMEELFNQKK